jgi:hypothetical protein
VIGPRRLAAALLAVTVAFGLSLTACGGGDPEPTPSATSTGPSTSPSGGPTPVPVGTEAIAEWASVWKDAFQRFMDDLSDVVIAIRNRDVDALRDALQRMPGHAREAVRKIDEAGAVPPGFDDEVRRIRRLVDQAGATAPKIAEDCIGNVGLACAADVATLLSVAAQILDALRPFGLGLDFKIEL